VDFFIKSVYYTKNKEIGSQNIENSLIILKNKAKIAVAILVHV